MHPKDINGVSRAMGGLDAETVKRRTYSDNGEGTTARQLVGRSFVQYAKMEIPPEEALLGNRWLCRGGGALIVAPSGQGKSVLTAQASILWACNKAAFGIKPSRPLRSLILQAEDDDGDIQKMGEIINHLNLKDHEIQMVDTNTFVNGTENYKPSDWMYRGSGSADITNWARAIMVIDPCANMGTFKFIAAKRGKRIGWGNEYPVYEEYFSHCKEEGKLLWIPSTEDKIRMAASSRQETVAKDLLPFIPDDEDANKEQIHAAINHSGKTVGINKVKRLLHELVTGGLICVIEVPRSGTRAEVKYRRR